MKVNDVVRVKRAPERIGTVREIRRAASGEPFALVSFVLETWSLDELVLAGVEDEVTP